jgi:hypothetical protein
MQRVLTRNRGNSQKFGFNATGLVYRPKQSGRGTSNQLDRSPHDGQPAPTNVDDPHSSHHRHHPKQVVASFAVSFARSIDTSHDDQLMPEIAFYRNSMNRVKRDITALLQLPIVWTFDVLSAGNVVWVEFQMLSLRAQRIAKSAAIGAIRDLTHTCAPVIWIQSIDFQSVRKHKT